ncbi:MAG: glycosyltransferase family 4 protein [Patescibacteria group bacterium]
MERLSYDIITGLGQHAPNITIVNRHGKWWLPFFLLYAIIKALAVSPRIDVVHLSDAVLAVIGWMVQRIYHKPVVCNVHGLDLIYSNKIYQWYLKIFFKPNKIICNSHNTERIANNMGLRSTVVITPGIDVKKFIPAKTDKALSVLVSKGIDPTKDKLILTVGRLIQRKGVVWFCENVLPELPHEYKYLIAGEGPEKARIGELAKKIPGRIFILGSLEQQLLDQVYQASHVFVMPNIQVKNDVEGFGFVGIEAAAWGLPVVAADIDGVIDGIVDGKNGYTVPSRDSAAFKNKIIESINIRKSDASVFESFRQYTIENFNWDRIIEIYRKEIQLI